MRLFQISGLVALIGIGMERDKASSDDCINLTILGGIKFSYINNIHILLIFNSKCDSETYLMAQHVRHVTPKNDLRKYPRISVLFKREDLLWRPNHDKPVRDPYTGFLTPVPLMRDSDTVAIGPNIYDAIRRVERTQKDLHELGLPSVKENLGDWYVLRYASDFFEDPKVLEKRRKRLEATGKKPSFKDGLFEPFKRSLCTLGNVVPGQSDDEFVLVQKKTTVLISKIVFTLAVGIYDGAESASAVIGKAAEEAWNRDLERARAFYDLVKSSPVGIHEKDVPDEIKATATISQEVEAWVLREVCSWLGVDPDLEIKRKKGRPAGQTGADLDDNSYGGEVVIIRMSDDGVITGEVLVDFSGYQKGLKLETLSLSEIAALLVELQDAGLATDAELVEAYLESADPDWRETVLGDDILGTAYAGIADPYEILGVDKNATLDQIKMAYRKAMQKVHPDRSGLPEFFSQQVISAYKTLKTRFKEQEYGDEQE